jgi:cytochrome c oxidase cbb3-type subunit 3
MNLGSSGTAYLASLRRAEAGLAKAETVEPTGEALVAVLKAPQSIAKGEGIFKTNCAACHGDQGQGVVGPNLADLYWLHGGTADAIVASIARGYPEKGMPPWKPTLGAEKVRLAAAYVMSLRGRPVQNPKAPQGEKVP